MASFVKSAGAELLETESNGEALITVTSCNVSPDLKNATLYISVLPEEKENAALGFCKRRRAKLRQALKKNLHTKVVPFVDIELDMGEKNRRRIDELLRD